jgi:hypothetical protein
MGVYMTQRNFYSLIMSIMLATSLSAHDVLLEGKAAAFFPTDSKFRKIYGSAGGIFGVELTGQLYRELYGWISTDVFAQNGNSLGLADPARVLFVPLDIGLKYLYRFAHVDLYVGIGASATYLQIKNNSPFVIQRQNKWGGGGIVKAGCNVGADPLFLDFFASYSFVKVGFNNSCTAVSTSDADISGASLGVGFGYRF